MKNGYCQDLKAYLSLLFCAILHLHFGPQLSLQNVKKFK